MDAKKNGDDEPEDGTDEEVYELSEDEPMAAKSKPSFNLGSVLPKEIASKKQAKKKAAAKAKALAAEPASGRARSRSRSPSQAALSSKKIGKSGNASDGLEDLDQEMSKVNQRAGGGKTCLRSLVVARHLGGEKLGVRLAAAWTPVRLFQARLLEDPDTSSRLCAFSRQSF